MNDEIPKLSREKLEELHRRVRDCRLGVLLEVMEAQGPDWIDDFIKALEKASE